MTTNNILQFPTSITIDAGKQLDLFDFSFHSLAKYSFIDVNDYNQDEIISKLESCKIRLILDIRKFPTFSKPNYNHKLFLKTLSEKDSAYVPLAYLWEFKMRFSQIKEVRQKIETLSQEGPILLFFDKREHNRCALNEWGNQLQTRFGNWIESSSIVHGR